MDRAQVVPAAVLIAATLVGCASGPAAEDEYPGTVRVGTLPALRVEVADTAAERSEGLSGRGRLPPRTGMLFRFDHEVTVGFWMYDVRLPLSLAWVRDRRVIGTVEMVPCAADRSGCPSYEPPGPYDAAIEAPAGTFAAVEPGTRVRVRWH